MKVGNLGCDSTEGGGINCNFGSGRIEDDSLFTSLSLSREELGFVGSSAECGSSQNPSVISFLVGDWESDQGFGEVVLDLSEEDLVDLMVSREEEGERLGLSLEVITQSLGEIFVLFVSRDLETNDSGDEVVIILI